VRKNIKARGRTKNYDDITDGYTVRLALKEKTFRKESEPTCNQDLHKVQTNNHNGLYMVDGSLHSRKDLQLVKGTVTAIKPKKTAKQVKQDKVGKAAYSPEGKVGKAAYSPAVKYLMGSSPTTEQVETMIDTKANETRRKQIDFTALANMNLDRLNRSRSQTRIKPFI
jgi:hypothetical protein